MVKESDFQAKIIRFLKSQGCVVIKYQQNATTKAAFPDVLFLKEGFWGAIEVKRSKTAKCRPGQKEMVAKLDDWSWAKIVYPENFEEVQLELKELLK